MTDLVPALTKFREAQSPKLTLEALAARLDISVGWLSRVERNGTANLRLAMRLAEVTGLPVEAFAPREMV